MPGKRWRSPTESAQAGRILRRDILGLAAVGLCHSERATLILKSVCCASYLSRRSQPLPETVDREAHWPNIGRFLL
jgi:hypothetical protein